MKGFVEQLGQERHAPIWMNAGAVSIAVIMTPLLAIIAVRGRRISGRPT